MAIVWHPPPNWFGRPRGIDIDLFEPNIQTLTLPISGLGSAAVSSPRLARDAVPSAPDVPTYNSWSIGAEPVMDQLARQGTDPGGSNG